MLILSSRPPCPFSKKVLAAAKDLGVGLEVRDIGHGLHCGELKRRGGKQQVPYLVDRAHGVEMYESEDIIAYLKGKKPEHAEPKGIQREVCPT